MDWEIIVFDAVDDYMYVKWVVVLVFIQNSHTGKKYLFLFPIPYCLDVSSTTAAISFILVKEPVN